MRRCCRGKIMKYPGMHLCVDVGHVRSEWDSSLGCAIIIASLLIRFVDLLFITWPIRYLIPTFTITNLGLFKKKIQIA